MILTLPTEPRLATRVDFEFVSFTSKSVNIAPGPCPTTLGATVVQGPPADAASPDATVAAVLQARPAFITLCDLRHLAFMIGLLAATARHLRHSGHAASTNVA